MTKNIKNISHCCETLKELRGKRTQEDVAKSIGVSTSTYGRLELGDVGYSIMDHVISLAKEFDVSLDYLFGMNDE